MLGNVREESRKAGRKVLKCASEEECHSAQVEKERDRGIKGSSAEGKGQEGDNRGREGAESAQVQESTSGEGERGNGEVRRDAEQTEGRSQM
jgi:hypothetical protein